MKSNRPGKWRSGLICGAMLIAAAAQTGCQISSAGVTLPSPYYFQDDIQYFRKGPEQKLSREAAALKAASADNRALNR